MTKFITCIFSGGMDSTTLLAQAISMAKTPENVLAVGFNYGQRHRKELISAAEIAQEFGVTYNIVDISSISKFLPGSSQTDMSVEVPHGHYAAENMKTTVVPGRNLMMLSIAAGIAEANLNLLVEARGLDEKTVTELWYGAHAGDHAIYPDCRPEFVNSAREAIQKSSAGKVLLIAPFIYSTKANICALGAVGYGIDFSKTWSCYEGGEIHCGRCSTCVERREAFEISEIPDPTEYEDKSDFWKTVTQ